MHTSLLPVAAVPITRCREGVVYTFRALTLGQMAELLAVWRARARAALEADCQAAGCDSIAMFAALRELYDRSGGPGWAFDRLIRPDCLAESLAAAGCAEPVGLPWTFSELVEIALETWGVVPRVLSTNATEPPAPDVPDPFVEPPATGQIGS